MIAPADFSVRQQALDIAQSFAVAAPAGSGKTGLLIQRMLALLAICEQPEQILCMTFTRKAAGEMRARLIDALISAAGEQPPADDYARQTWQFARDVLARDREQNWQLIRSPNRLRIITIDGFCRNLAQLLSAEAGIGELPEPTENPDPCYRLAISELLGELETDGTPGEALERLLAHTDNDIVRLEGLLMRLLQKREQWLPHIFASRDARPVLESFLGAVNAESVACCRTLFASRTGELLTLADYAAQHLAVTPPAHDLVAWQGLQQLPDTTSAWRGITDLLVTKDNKGWRAKVDKRLGFPTKKDAIRPELADTRKEQWQALVDWCRSEPGLLEALIDLRYVPDPAFGDPQWQILEALTRTLPRLVGHLDLVFRRTGVTDFAALSLSALNALGDADNPTDLTLQLDYQIQHILVDEFQDTSSLQFDLLRRLTAGWQPGDGRTLFIVGDGMQSLYGFRNANVGLFLDARRHPVGDIALQPLDLTANFRSQTNLINWVNRVFKGAFPALPNPARGAVPYSASSAVKPALHGPAVIIDIFAGRSNRRAEAQRVADHVGAALRDNSAGTVALLVRSRGHLREILPALYEQGFSWLATDIDPLATRMAVIDLTSLTRALLCPADRVAWLSVLRAPWCGLDNHDLLQLVNTPLADSPLPEGTQYPLLLTQLINHREMPLSPQGQKILARVVPVLRQAWGQRHRKPLRTWIEGIWITLGGPAALRDTAALSHCRQYFEVLEARTDDALNNWPIFRVALERLYAAPAASADTRLHIMTVHKAKGLEFDTVIIPGLDRGGRGNDTELLLWRERISAAGHTQLLISPPPAVGQDKDALYEHLKREEKLKTQLENVRVLYVACTRAIRRLHLLFRLPEQSNPSQNSLLAALWPQLEQELPQPPADTQILHHPAPADADSPEAPATTDFYRLPPDWCFTPHPEADTNTSAANIAVANDPRHNGDAESRHIGTVLHRTLRQITLEGVARWNAERINRQQRAWAIQLQQLGVSDTQDAIGQLTTAITNTLADGQGCWLLDNTHSDSACELALGYVDDGLVRTAIIDRTFVDDRVRWIIDYKSATPQAGQSIDAFTRQQRQNYSAQLDRYAALYRGERDVLLIKRALFFPLIPYLDVLPD